MQPTKVLFSKGVAESDARVLLVSGRDVVTEQTPFHPVSHIWPDHPADKGWMEFNGQRCEVSDCLTGAVELASGELYVGEQIPVKRDSEGWVFVVVHRLAEESGTPATGDSVRLLVDKAYQDSLSRGHSAGHIAYLALNKVLGESYWRKEADRRDPLGWPDFNSYAQVSSVVMPDRCHDVYRLGKTLRKRGLNSADVVQELSDIAQRANQQVASWLQSPVPVELECHGEALTDSRYWRCQLDEEVVTPCGGTHVSHLSELGEVEITLREVDLQHIEMHTCVRK